MAVKVQKYAGGTGGGPEWWSQEYKEERKQVTEGCGAFTKDVYEKTQHVRSMMKVTTAPLETLAMGACGSLQVDRPQDRIRADAQQHVRAASQPRARAGSAPASQPTARAGSAPADVGAAAERSPELAAAESGTPAGSAAAEGGRGGAGRGRGSGTPTPPSGVPLRQQRIKQPTNSKQRTKNVAQAVAEQQRARESSMRAFTKQMKRVEKKERKQQHKAQRKERKERKERDKIREKRENQHHAQHIHAMLTAATSNSRAVIVSAASTTAVALATRREGGNYSESFQQVMGSVQPALPKPIPTPPPPTNSGSNSSSSSASDDDDSETEKAQLERLNRTCEARERLEQGVPEPGDEEAANAVI